MPYKNRAKQRKCGRESMKRSRDSRRLLVEAYKNQPCLDCGHEFHPCVMEFDHCRGTKMFNIGSFPSCSMVRLIAELAKCDVVCANCHKIRGFKRGDHDGHSSKGGRAYRESVKKNGR